MCVVSMIGDHYHDKWKDFDWDWWNKQNPFNNPGTSPYNPADPFQFPPEVKYPEVSRFEFELLKKEVMEMKALLTKALEYDKKNNEPHCEMEEKLATLRKIAELVGINLDDILGKQKS